MSVTFATKCWGGDYHKFLSGAFERKKSAIGYLFDKEYLVVNNGIPEGISFPFNTVDAFNAPSVLNVYARGEVAAVFAAKTDYICFVQGDAITEGGDWVTPALKILENELDVFLVSPASEVNTWHNVDGYDHYCSDQAFIARVSDLQEPVTYSVEGIDTDYPSYGGDSFEHMIGKYLKATGKKRKILEEFYVHHPAY
jgi:hypothetical protein